jgi:paraquat-inducible protein B
MPPPNYNSFLQRFAKAARLRNVNAALASANSAAQAIEDAAESLPALSAQAGALVSQTQSVVDSYSERSRFNQETLSTLRDIQSAADAISALARTIQRNPSSLLTGR